MTDRIAEPATAVPEPVYVNVTPSIVSVGPVLVRYCIPAMLVIEVPDTYANEVPEPTWLRCAELYAVIAELEPCVTMLRPLLRLTEFAVNVYAVAVEVIDADNTSVVALVMDETVIVPVIPAPVTTMPG